MAATGAPTALGRPIPERATVAPACVEIDPVWGALEALVTFVAMLGVIEPVTVAEDTDPNVFDADAVIDTDPACPALETEDDRARQPA